MNKKTFLFVLLAAIFAVTTISCAPVPTPRSNQPTTTGQLDVCRSPLRVVAASEVKTLEDAGIFKDFTKETCVPLAITYKGSVDIKNLVLAYTAKNAGDIDVWWAASTLWLPGSFVQNKTFVARTYNVLGVDKGAAASMGWSSQKGITSTDIISAVKKGQLKLVAASASQDDSAANFFLSYLTSLRGTDQALRKEDLSDPAIVAEIKAFYNAVGRSAPASESAKQIYLDDHAGGKPQFNGVILPEVLAIALNRELIAKNLGPVTVFYVKDAVTTETFPVGYSDKAGSEKVEQFKKLTGFLKSVAVQEKLKALGWRTNSVGMKVDNPDPAVFNIAWGVDSQTEFVPITLPKEAVIDEAINLYQSALRPPSYTVYCLDRSGSMQGKGITDLKNAVDLLFDQTRAATVLLQATPQDESVVYAFNNNVDEVGSASGNDPAKLKDLSNAVNRISADGGTAMFDCLRAAMDRIAKNYDPVKYRYAIIAMTDGDSNAGMSSGQFPSHYQSRKLPVPIFGIAFGSVNMGQLNVFKNLKIDNVAVPGDVCEGYKGGEDLVLCFRKAKSGN